MDFRDIISYSHLAEYLTAEFGKDLAVFEDGSVEIIESSLAWKQGGPIARVQCPGIGNLDSTVFSDGFSRRGESTGEYYEIESSRRIGSLKDLIEYSCQYGDVSSFYDELIKRLEDSFRESQ